MLRHPLVFRTLFLSICFFVFTYPVMRLSTWLGMPIGAVGTILLWVIGIISMWHSFRGPNMVVRYVVVHWMGASFVLAMLVLCYDLLSIPFDFDHAVAAKWLIAIAAVIVIGAFAASHHLNVNKIEIHSHKLAQKQRVVQISDVHIGSRQGGYMARIVNRINRLEPDIVVITGDLIDSSSVEIEDLQPLADIGAPAFFCVGNHERYADLPKALDMLERLDVKPLRQQSHDLAGVHLHGIDDADSPQQVARELPNLELHREHFNILLYHRPNGWEDAIDHGVDLMLSGHTHNGQIFPFNYIVKQQFVRIKGHYQQDGAHLYVNRGTGTWGPLMRLGSLNEISCFDLVPVRK
jgi:predicted MPP superfamily phosphohydrolase